MEATTGPAGGLGQPLWPRGDTRVALNGAGEPQVTQLGNDVLLRWRAECAVAALRDANRFRRRGMSLDWVHGPSAAQDWPALAVLAVEALVASLYQPSAFSDSAWARAASVHRTAAAPLICAELLRSALDEVAVFHELQSRALVQKAADLDATAAPADAATQLRRRARELEPLWPSRRTDTITAHDPLVRLWAGSLPVELLPARGGVGHGAPRSGPRERTAGGAADRVDGRENDRGKGSFTDNMLSELVTGPLMAMAGVAAVIGSAHLLREVLTQERKTSELNWHRAAQEQNQRDDAAFKGASAEMAAQEEAQRNARAAGGPKALVTADYGREADAAMYREGFHVMTGQQTPEAFAVNALAGQAAMAWGGLTTNSVDQRIPFIEQQNLNNAMRLAIERQQKSNSAIAIGMGAPSVDGFVGSREQAYGVDETYAAALGRGVQYADTGLAFTQALAEGAEFFVGAPARAVQTLTMCESGDLRGVGSAEIYRCVQQSATMVTGATNEAQTYMFLQTYNTYTMPRDPGVTARFALSSFSVVDGGSTHGFVQSHVGYDTIGSGARLAFPGEFLSPQQSTTVETNRLVEGVGQAVSGLVGVYMAPAVASGTCAIALSNVAASSLAFACEVYQNPWACDAHTTVSPWINYASLANLAQGVVTGALKHGANVIPHLLDASGDVVHVHNTMNSHMVRELAASDSVFGPLVQENIQTVLAGEYGAGVFDAAASQGMLLSASQAAQTSAGKYILTNPGRAVTYPQVAVSAVAEAARTARDTVIPGVQMSLNAFHTAAFLGSADMASRASYAHAIQTSRNDLRACLDNYRDLTDHFGGAPPLDGAFLTLDACQARSLGVVLRHKAEDLLRRKAEDLLRRSGDVPVSVPVEEVAGLLHESLDLLLGAGEEGPDAYQRARATDALVQRLPTSPELPGYVSLETLDTVAMYVTQGLSGIGAAFAPEGPVTPALARLMEASGGAQWRCTSRLYSEQDISAVCAPRVTLGGTVAASEGGAWAYPEADRRAYRDGLQYRVARTTGQPEDLAVGFALGRTMDGVELDNYSGELGPGGKVVDSRRAGEVQLESDGGRVPLDRAVFLMARANGRNPDVGVCPSQLAAGVASWYVPSGAWPGRPPDALIAAIRAEDAELEQYMNDRRSHKNRDDPETFVSVLHTAWGKLPQDTDWSDVTWEHVALLGSAHPTLLYRVLQRSGQASAVFDASFDGTGGEVRVRRLRPAVARRDQVARSNASAVARVRAARSASAELAAFSEEVQLQADRIANPALLYTMGVLDAPPVAIDGELGDAHARLVEATTKARSRAPELARMARVAFLQKASGAPRGAPPGAIDPHTQSIRDWLAEVGASSLADLQMVLRAADAVRMAPLTGQLADEARKACLVSATIGQPSGAAVHTAGGRVVELFRCALGSEMRRADELPDPHGPAEPAPHEALQLDQGGKWDEAGRLFMRIVAPRGSRDSLTSALQRVSEAYGDEAAWMVGATYSSLLGEDLIDSLVTDWARAVGHYHEWEAWARQALDAKTNVSDGARQAVFGLYPGAALSAAVRVRPGASETDGHLRKTYDRYARVWRDFQALADNVLLVPVEDPRGDGADSYYTRLDPADVEKAEAMFDHATVQSPEKLKNAIFGSGKYGHYYASVRMRSLTREAAALNAELAGAEHLAVAMDVESLAVTMGCEEARYRVDIATDNNMSS